MALNPNWTTAEALKILADRRQPMVKMLAAFRQATAAVDPACVTADEAVYAATRGFVNYLVWYHRTCRPLPDDAFIALLDHSHTAALRVLFMGGIEMPRNIVGDAVTSNHLAHVELLVKMEAPIAPNDIIASSFTPVCDFRLSSVFTLLVHDISAEPHDAFITPEVFEQLSGWMRAEIMNEASMITRAVINSLARQHRIPDLRVVWLRKPALVQTCMQEAIGRLAVAEAEDAVTPKERQDRLVLRSILEAVPALLPDAIRCAVTAWNPSPRALDVACGCALTELAQLRGPLHLVPKPRNRDAVAAVMRGPDHSFGQFRVALMHAWKVAESNKEIALVLHRYGLTPVSRAAVPKPPAPAFNTIRAFVSFLAKN